MNEICPSGVIAMRPLAVLWCLYVANVLRYDLLQLVAALWWLLYKQFDAVYICSGSWIVHPEGLWHVPCLAISVNDLVCLTKIKSTYLQFISRFGFKSGICLLIAPVPVHCFSITFDI